MNVAFMGESVNEKAGVGFGFPALTACPIVMQCRMRNVFCKLSQKLPSASLPWVSAFCSGSGWSAIVLFASETDKTSLMMSSGDKTDPVEWKRC